MLTQSLQEHRLVYRSDHKKCKAYPRGTLARTSTRPYRMLALLRVVILALCIGLIIVPVVLLLTAPQAW
jgi:hypothetical protein